MPKGKPYVAIAILVGVGLPFVAYGLLLLSARGRSAVYALVPIAAGGYLIAWAYNVARDNGRF
jgi:hypothetical protein